MTVDEISRLAYSGTPPDTAQSHEWLLWFRLREIYQRVLSGMDTKTAGRLAKEDAVRRYEVDRDQFNRSVLFWKRIEAPGTAFAKEPTIENAVRLYEAVYGIEIGTSHLASGESDRNEGVT